MKADYSIISKVYDNNSKRQHISKDSNIQDILDKNKTSDVHVLDIGCGTGIYFEKQHSFYKFSNISWHGIDPSEEMLAIAKTKNTAAAFTVSYAEEIPFPDNSFDYITMRFSFHHMTDKAKVLREVSRVLKRGGLSRYENIDPFIMQDWWVFKYFPKTVDIVNGTYWTIDALIEECAKSGLSYKKTSKENTNTMMPMYEIYNEASMRDISQLNILSDSDYQLGLKAIMKDMDTKTKPVSEGVILTNVIFYKE
jgi:ubiquinone/menaquinone biosynthesis C-methylase UbiE